jgi:hypothetical protein
MSDRTGSPAYGALRASSRRLLLFVEQEIARNGGKPVTIYNDQFNVVGSIKVVLPGPSELHALGLIEVTRFPKRHGCAMSERCRDIRTMRDAKIVSVVARVQRKPPVLTPPQPATASSNVQA